MMNIPRYFYFSYTRISLNYVSCKNTSLLLLHASWEGRQANKKTDNQYSAQQKQNTSDNLLGYEDMSVYLQTDRARVQEIGKRTCK